VKTGGRKDLKNEKCNKGNEVGRKDLKKECETQRKEICNVRGMKMKKVGGGKDLKRKKWKIRRRKD
jgi:hypothetical protein